MLVADGKSACNRPPTSQSSSTLARQSKTTPVELGHRGGGEHAP